MDFLFLVELFINGMNTGLMYSLVALGISMIYKASGVPNLAQGAMVMIAGYLLWATIALLGLSLWIAIPSVIVLMFLAGLAIERWLLRRMVGQPVLMIVMLTLGLEILLRGVGPGVFDAAPKRLDLGLGLAPLVVADVFINRAYLIGAIGASILILLAAAFFRTRLGTKLRAVSDDHVASWAVGISVERAIGISWGIAGVAAVGAGTIWGSVQGVDWTLSALLFPAIAVVILGGIDSLLGVFVGGLIVGVLGSVVPGYLDPIVGGGTRDVVTSVLIVLTILLRPYGIFGREDIERV